MEPLVARDLARSPVRRRQKRCLFATGRVMEAHPVAQVAMAGRVDGYIRPCFLEFGSLGGQLTGAADPGTACQRAKGRPLLVQR
jgi:hypothetical protein